LDSVVSHLDSHLFASFPHPRKAADDSRSERRKCEPASTLYGQLAGERGGGSNSSRCPELTGFECVGTSFAGLPLIQTIHYILDIFGEDIVGVNVSVRRGDNPHARVYRTGLGRESTHVTIDTEIGESASGVLYALGGASGGVTLYMDKGELFYEYNMMIIERYVTRSQGKLAAGRHRIEVDTTILRPGAPAVRRPGRGDGHRRNGGGLRISPVGRNQRSRFRHRH
jgi:hypothetical protein